MFGQLVIGPPGSGKTTYCSAMREFLTKLGRNVAVVNLDPANDHLPYDCAIDLSSLVCLDEVMDELQLGPNGGLVYCMDYLLANVDWLISQLAALPSNTYLLIDCPGQVELYTHDSSMRSLLTRLCSSAGGDYRLCAVHLCDSHLCADPGKFLSLLMTALCGMLSLGLPHVNLLSKADLIDQDGLLPFNADFFAEVLDLNYLLDKLNDDLFFAKYRKFNQALVGLIEDHSLVSFTMLDIQSEEMMLRVSQRVDKALGYIFGSDPEQRSIQTLLSSAMASDFTSDSVAMVQEKYVGINDPPNNEPVDEEMDFLA